MKTNLFRTGDFTLHSGGEISSWKIDCDALRDEDWETLAFLISRRYKFGQVVGIPNGGLKLAKALEKYRIDVYKGEILIVDDVLTTGKSMEEEKKNLKSKPYELISGCVVFARGKCPEWITPIFQMTL